MHCKIMDMPNKVQLKSANFQDNISSSFQQLRRQPDFSDVTLVSEDKQKFDLHRVILSGGSGFFKNILGDFRNDPHPLIYLRGVQAKTLAFIVDFIYDGSVNLTEEDLNNFLLLASELHLNGLSTCDEREDIKHLINSTMEEQPLKLLGIKNEVAQSKQLGRLPALEKSSQATREKIAPDVEEGSTMPSDRKPVIVRFREKNEDLTEKILSMIVRTALGWSCLGCEKSSTRKPGMMKHAEIHIDGFSHSCDHCDKKFGTSNGLQFHVSSSLYCRRAQAMVD